MIIRQPSFLARKPLASVVLGTAISVVIGALAHWAAGIALFIFVAGLIAGHRLGYAERPTHGRIKIVGAVNQHDQKYRKPQA